MTALGDLDRARIGELYAQELAAARADVTRYLEAYHDLLAQLG